MSATAPARRTFHHPIQQDTATFIETTAESGGERTLAEIDLSPGGGNEPHVHRAFEEHFEALAGVLTVRLGDQVRRLAPGDTAVVPRGVLHCFANDTGEPVRFRVALRPGHLGFERAIQVAYGLAADGRCNAKGMPSNAYHLAVLTEWSDTHLTGAMRAAGPVLRVLARRARAKGIDRELRERYCAW